MNVLAIGAHFDDIELGCGGTIAKHVSEGDDVSCYVVTLSGYKNPKGKIIRSNEIAKEEGKQALQVLGVNNIFYGNFETMNIEFTEELNRELLTILESNNFDIVYTHWHGDIHHDHQAVSKSALHCSRHIPKILMYRSNWYDSPYVFRNNFYVDISKYWDKKIEAIMKHKSEIQRTNNRWIEFITNECKNIGCKAGVDYAEAFEVVRWLQL